MLTPYQSLEFNKDKLTADLSVAPFIRKIEYHLENAHIQLENIPGHEVLPYPSVINLTNNDCALIDYINNYRKNEKKIPFSECTRILWGSHSHAPPRHFYSADLIVDIAKHCKELNLDCKIIQIELPKVELTGKNWLCSLNFHNWEKEPQIKDYVKSTGIHFFFFSTGIQKGILRCKRCGQEKKVYTEGVAGAGISTKWRKLTPQQEESIDRLPRL